MTTAPPQRIQRDFQDDLVTSAVAASIIGVTTSSVRNYRKAGVLTDLGRTHEGPRAPYLYDRDECALVRLILKSPASPEALNEMKDRLTTVKDEQQARYVEWLRNEERVKEAEAKAQEEAALAQVAEDFAKAQAEAAQLVETVFGPSVDLMERIETVSEAPEAPEPPVTHTLPGASPEAPEGSALLTTLDIAGLLCISRATVTRLVREGRLPVALRVGRLLRFDRDEVLNALKSERV